MKWILSMVMAVGLMGATREYHDAGGFTLQIPEGWQVKRYDHGVVQVSSPSQTQIAYIIPVLGRTLDCTTMLKKNLEGGWPAFPGVKDLHIEAAGRGAAIARFAFQQGASKGAALCAETGPRTGMLYALGAAVSEYPAAQPIMAAVLKSFRYSPAAAGATNPLPPMTKWREQNEGAFTIPIPQGWQVQGGITRISNTDVRGGIRIWSPDQTSLIQFNDVRIDKVLVMGRTPMPPAQMGRGWRIGPHQSGVQVADWYLRQVFASELGLNNIEITSRQERPDLGAAADRLPAQMGVRGVQHSYGEVSFRGSRQGKPVEGRLLGMTRMMWTPNPDLAGGSFDIEIKGYLGPSGTGASLARIGGYIEANTEHNYQWIMANRQAAAGDVQRTMDQLHSTGEMQQKAFWDRMDAADRRAAGVGDVLSGTVRLQDGQGNRYEAKAGSNFYFFDEQAGRLAGKPNDAVAGTNIYPQTVDLRPLEIIR